MVKVKNETPKARKALQIYCELGPERSIRKAADTYREMYGKCSNQYLELLSRSHGWVERARAYDIEQEKELRSRHLKEIVEVQKRHAQEAKLLQKVAIERLKSAKPQQLKIGDCSRFLKDGVEIERNALGLKDKADIEVNVENVDARVQNVLSINKAIISTLERFPDAQQAVLKVLESEEKDLIND